MHRAYQDSRRCFLPATGCAYRGSCLRTAPGKIPIRLAHSSATGQHVVRIGRWTGGAEPLSTLPLQKHSGMALAIESCGTGASTVQRHRRMTGDPQVRTDTASIFIVPNTDLVNTDGQVTGR